MKTTNDNKDFKTPEGYFEGFTDRLLQRIAAAKDDPSDSLLPKSDGFSVPDHYFDELNSKLQSRLDRSESRVIALNPRRHYLYYAAAVVAVACLTIGIFYTRSVQPTFEGLAKSEIEDYFEHTDLSLSTYEMAEVIPVDDLEISDVLENQFEEGVIIEYLNENVDHIEELNLTDYEY